MHIFCYKLKLRGKQNAPLKGIGLSVYRKLYIFMSEEHKMTSQDKLVLGITLAAIFGGVFILGFIGLVINIFG